MHLMLQGEMFVLTVQSSRFSHYCSEFPAVNMSILKNSNLNIINGVSAFHFMRRECVEFIHFITWRFLGFNMNMLTEGNSETYWEKRHDWTVDTNLRAWYMIKCSQNYVYCINFFSECLLLEKKGENWLLHLNSMESCKVYWL